MGVGFITRRGGKPIKEKHWLEFDGVDDYTKITNNITSGFSQLSIALWMRPETGGSNYRCAIHKATSTAVGTSEYWIGVSEAEYLVATIGAADGPGWDGGETNISVSYGQWYHMAMTWDGSTVRVYVDGVFILDYALSSLTAPNEPTRLGASSDGDNYEYSGDIKNVQIWSKALTQQEIQDYMANPPSGQEPGIVAYYDFSDGVGTTLTDKAGNNDGTIHGATWINGVVINDTIYVKDE